MYKLSKTNIFFSRFEGTRGEKTKYFAPWSKKVENAVQMQNVANKIITKPIAFKTDVTQSIEQNSK